MTMIDLNAVVAVGSSYGNNHNYISHEPDRWTVAVSSALIKDWLANSAALRFLGILWLKLMAPASVSQI